MCVHSTPRGVWGRPANSQAQSRAPLGCLPRAAGGSCPCLLRLSKPRQQAGPRAEAVPGQRPGARLVHNVHDEAAGLEGRPLPPLVVDSGEEDLRGQRQGGGTAKGRYELAERCPEGA